jgi:dihydrofolate reductase
LSAVDRSEPFDVRRYSYLAGCSWKRTRSKILSSTSRGEAIGEHEITFHLSPQSAEHWGQWVAGLGALVCGRALFDFTNGWGGRHTIDVPVIVVTHQVPTAWVEAHPDAPFHFVTDGIEAAVATAQNIAGNRIVAVTAGTIARQCLELGLLDAVAVDLVPVVMGKGRPFFGELSVEDVQLGDPTACVQGDRVLHLLFPVIRDAPGAR